MALPPNVILPGDSDEEDKPLFPEDFCTDSDVHVFKLSDEEFKSRKNLLYNSLKIVTLVPRSFPPDRYSELSCQWNQDMKEQYTKVLENRETFSLPLPEPINLCNLSKLDLTAVFEKMHSRAFSRSFRLSESVNEILTRNITKFSVRIKDAAIHTGYLYGNRCDDLYIQNNQRFSGHVRIRDVNSILPFTFEGHWSENRASELVNRMKHPFVKLEIYTGRKSVLSMKPWMVNVAHVTFDRKRDDEDENTIKQMKPHMVWFPKGNDRFTRELWDSVDCVAGIYYCDLEEIVQLWKSGIWNYKVSKFRCWNQEYADLISFLPSCLFWTFGDEQMVFVPNPQTKFLVVHIYQSKRPQPYVNVYLGIHNLADMIIIKLSPIDHSAYQFDPDEPLVPYAYCDLLFAYYSTWRVRADRRLPFPLP